MNKHEQPIRIVAQRPEDRRRPESGGGGGAKEIVKVTPKLRRQLGDQIGGVASYFAQSFAEQSDIPGVAVVTLRRKALAKSHRPFPLLESAGCPVIGSQSIGELLVSVSKDSLSRLSSTVRKVNTKIGIANVSTIEKIRPYSATEVLRGTSLNAIRQWAAVGHKLRVTLFRYRDSEANARVETAFIHWATNKHVMQHRDSFSTLRSDFILNPLQEAAIIEELTKFVGIRSVLPVPVYFPLDIGVQMTPIAAATELNCPPPMDGLTYPIVGVIDSGVASGDPLIAPWIHAVRNYVADADADPRHGTFVSGLVVGSRPLNHGALEFPATSCKIVDIRALSKRGANEDDLKAIILEAVQAHPEVRVWNLSLGADAPCDANAFSPFAQFLDQLHDKFGCLFVCASGNYLEKPCRTWPPQLHIGDADRISAPSESVRSLTVGSIAHRDSPATTVKIGEPSPFSRRGPGPGFIPKPEVVHFGGNCSSVGQYAQTGVLSLLPGATLAESVGTSFSTPIVSSLAAHIFSQLGNRATPSATLVKGLTVHAALLASPVRTAEDVKYFGFGRPGDAVDALHCDDNAFTLLFDVELLDGFEFFKFPYPIPDELRTPDGLFRGEVLVTLVYSPPVDPAHAEEYCRANVDVSFGTYDFGADGKRHHESKVPPMPKDMAQLYEEHLIEHGFKWSPVKVYRRRAPQGIRGQDWRLAIRLVRRAGEPIPVEPQRATVIVTLRSIDPADQVYNKGVQLLNNLGWASASILQQVRV